MSENQNVKRLSYAYPVSYLNQINEQFYIASPSGFNLREVRKPKRDGAETRRESVLIDISTHVWEKEFRSRHLEVSYIIRSLRVGKKNFR